MNKNVLILSSSPRRKGNSDTLCDQFVLGVRHTGHVAEKIFLRDKKINHCTGCGVCFEGNKSCPQKDDMPEILEKMVKADVIVMATPVYFYTMCGQMKTLIDRTCPRYTELNNKAFYFIATAAVTNKRALDRTFDEFRGFTDCLDNPTEKGVIYGAGVWNVGDIEGSNAMEQAFEMGKTV
ncbi:MAG: flavodoxin family protein [Breznakibacter sp.]